MKPTIARKVLLGFAAGALFGLSACGSSDKGGIEIPNEFDAAFVTGTFCAPTQAKTGTDGSSTAPTYPVRIDTCIYRCVSVDRSTSQPQITASWTCVGSSCQLILLPTAHLKKVANQANCDANELPSPPSSECTSQEFDFELDPPSVGSGADTKYEKGLFSVTVPYLTMSQGEELIDKVDGGEAPATALQEVVGTQVYPSRTFAMSFDPSYAQVTVDELTNSDCHEIPAP